MVIEIIKDDIWNYLYKYPIVITTNGFVKNNGQLVMGKGIAQQARDKFKNLELDKYLGSLVSDIGNVPHCIWINTLTEIPPTFISFPVKPIKSSFVQDLLDNKFNQFKDCKWFPGWACEANKEIIANSFAVLRYLIDYHKIDKIVLPKVGCGNGGLEWQEVEGLILKYFSDLIPKLMFVDKN